MTSTEKEPCSRAGLSPITESHPRRPTILLLVAVLTAAAITTHLWQLLNEEVASILSPWNDFVQCSIKSLDTSAVKQPLVEELPVEEYLERRDRLASALVEEELDAFVVEPGFTEVYYANLSSYEWESWEPEERPFLLIIEPVFSDDGNVVARSTFVTPAFELQRALALNLPNDGPISYVTWEEHEDPFHILAKYLRESADTRIRPPKTISDSIRIVCDDEMRLFIAQGLATAGLQVVTYSYTAAYALVKQIKSLREIALLRAVNTLTVEGIRAVQQCAYTGISELELSLGLDAVLRSVPGVEPFFDLVLFGENAACPHCSSSSTRTLDPEKDMILVDVGAHLYGYSSDVCRTFFLPNRTSTPSKADPDAEKDWDRKPAIWQTVLDAQTASLEAFRPGLPAAGPDIAARAVITAAGYKRAFTHRLGHGIGIKAHEPPYLNKGNVGTVLKAGMVFTTEPGIYLKGDVGVRHEDVVLVVEEGEVEVLSGRRARSPWEP